MDKRLTAYNKEWEKEFPWVIPVKGNIYKANCLHCKTDFYVGNMGKAAITQHLKVKTHKTAVLIKSNSQSIKNYVKIVGGDEDLRTTAAELSSVFHSVKHHHSYNSLDCGIKLNSKIFYDSKISNLISCGRTKSQAFVCNVLGTKAEHIVTDQLINSNPPVFFSIQTDASNKKNMKMFPVCVQFFTLEDGIVNYLIDFYENPDETADGMYKKLVITFANLSLDWNRVSSFSADNANCNFGINHSLYTNLQKQNQEIFKANCNAHIVNNAVKFAMGNLQIDLENIVLKIYGHFSISAKRRENLKEFHVFAESEFQEILRHVTTRWLSLRPCIERILTSWDALESYFVNSRQDCPKQIYNLLELSETSEEIPKKIKIYFLFAKYSLGLFNDAILALEGNKISILDVYDVFNKLKKSLEQRNKQNFFGYEIVQEFKNFQKHEIIKIEKDFKEFYNKALEYIAKRFDFSEDTLHARLTKFRISPDCNLTYLDFCEILENCNLKTKLNINMDILFEDFIDFEEIFTILKEKEDFKKLKNSGDRWHEIFKASNTKMLNIFKVMGFFLSFPGTSSFCERVFSVMGIKWRDDRNRSSVKLIKNELMIYFNFKESCTQFSENILKDREFLKAAKSSAKYDFKQN